MPPEEGKRSGRPGNSVDDGFVFRISLVPDDLAVESFGYAPAGGVFDRCRVDETFLAQVFMRPCSQRSHDFPTKTLAVRAFLYPEAQFGRWPVAVFQPRHAEAFIAIAPSDDEGKDIRVRGPHSFFASRNVFAPGGRVPSHEPGDRGRDARKNLLCVRYLKLAELQPWGLNKDHFGDQKRAALCQANLTMIVVEISIGRKMLPIRRGQCLLRLSRN